jgi:AraC-like DNA-binding protein
LRLEFAAKELAESNKSLAEIANGAGFYDQSHFSNQFRRLMNMTPSQFRTELKKTGQELSKKHRSSKTWLLKN